jgi:hypothetical protein
MSEIKPIPHAAGFLGTNARPWELFKRYGPHAGVVLICLIFSAILWTVFLAQVRFERERIVESKRQENGNLARMFEQHVARTIRAAEITLREIASEYSRYGSKFDLVQYAKNRGTYLDPYTGLSIVDEKGDRILASFPLPPETLNLSTVPDYQYHAQHDTPGLFISGPRLGIVTGRWTIFLSIRINKADRSFAGYAAVGMDPTYFSTIYSELDLGKDSVVTLLGRDGIIRVRSAGANVTAGQNLINAEVFRRLPAANHGSYIGRSMVDQVTRIFSYRALKDYPLVVVIGTSQAVALSDLDQRTSRYATGASGITLVILCLGLFTLFQIETSKRAERTLRASEARFRSLTKLSSDWYWEQDERFRFNVMSAGLHAKARLRAESTLGKLRWELPIVGVSAEAWNAHRTLLERHEPFHDFDYQMVNETGEKRWFSISGEPIFDAQGTFKGYRGTGRDITQRKEADQVTGRLAAIVDSSYDAILSRSMDLKVLTWNAAAERLFGYSASETIGRDISFIIPPDRQAEVAQKRALLAADRPTEPYDTVRLAKDGRRIDVSVTQSPIKDMNGNLIGVSITVRDIVERKRAEAELRLAASVFDNALDGIFVTDENFNMITVNRAFTDITGYSATEAIGQTPRLLRSYRHDEAFYETMRLAIVETGSWQGEIWDKRKNGELYCELLSISAVRDERGEITNYCAVFADITRRKVAEAELMRLNAELEERVAMRTQELERANHELGAFSYSVSHDLRAPLRAMIGFSAILMNANRDKLDSESFHHLQRIQDGAQRMTQLIDDLLDLARISRQEMHRVDFNLSALAGEAAESLVQADPQRTVRVTVQPDMHAHGDPRLVRIALDNLLGNAWKFTARTAEARIEVGQDEHDGETVFFVRDNGAGFDMQYADKLFGAFQRLHGQEEFEGTGIGLSIVQRIFSRHGGRVWAEGKVGQGATFYFTFGAH